jgi:hypothetical protein
LPYGKLGLAKHTEELRTFIFIYNIDVILISEMHFTEKNYLKLRNYTAYHTTNPVGTAPSGTARIIKNSLKNHQINNYSKNFLQATSVSILDPTDPLTISGVYFPPDTQ